MACRFPEGHASLLSRFVAHVVCSSCGLPSLVIVPIICEPSDVALGHPLLHNTEKVDAVAVDMMPMCIADQSSVCEKGTFKPLSTDVMTCQGTAQRPPPLLDETAFFDPEPKSRQPSVVATT